jgi:hypothetical protein
MAPKQLRNKLVIKNTVGNKIAETKAVITNGRKAVEDKPAPEER